jgi:D-sedoheptulose 7-phosphate isomerase
VTAERRVRAWLTEAARAIQAIDAKAVADAAAALAAVRARGNTIFVAGNGGSASTASHLVLDLQKATRANGKPGTRALALSDNMGLVTAWGNDVDFERVFAEQLQVLGSVGDGLVVISVSGSSPNLLALLECARDMRLVTVGLLGESGGKARSLVDHAVLVPSGDYGWVESAHVVLHHVLTYALRDGAGGSESGPVPSRMQ